MSTQPEPATEAGRRLLTDITDLETVGATPVSTYLGPTGVLRAVLAIEAEASRTATAAARAEVAPWKAALASVMDTGHSPWLNYVEQQPCLCVVHEDARRLFDAQQPPEVREPER